MSRRILVTSALPYINGPIHIGHLVEYLQTDIWVRFQRMQGNVVTYLCADDTHGTATMIRARQEGRSEVDLIRDMSRAHQQDFADFSIVFDHYGSTDSPSNRVLVYEIWAALRAAGHVAEREVVQLFDPQAGCFLADRFVKGTCPICGTRDQYGDSCEQCSSTYAASELLDAVSVLSGARPELRSATHYFVRLEPFRALVEGWVGQGDHLQGSIARWLERTFLSGPLRDWDVSRPAPYFGFEIPDAPGHYFYVWLDAPVGYLSSLTDWLSGDVAQARAWWPRRGDPGYDDPSVEIHHFIGKDISYFHTLFWPAMLDAAGYKLPTRVHVHGFLTVNGAKMSKRTGTFIKARTYLEHLDPAYLRYYYASKLTAEADDLDLNVTEFEEKVNADVVGKVVNLASRSARFVPTLAAIYPDDQGLFARAAAAGASIAEGYERGDFSRAMREIMGLADAANAFVAQAAPWNLKKDPGKAGALLDCCTIALNLFRQLAVYLAPVLPRLAEQAGTLLGSPITRWADAGAPVLGTTLAPFAHMLDRVDPKGIGAMVTASAEAGVGTASPQADPALPGTAVAKAAQAIAAGSGARAHPRASSSLETQGTRLPETAPPTAAPPPPPRATGGHGPLRGFQQARPAYRPH